MSSLARSFRLAGIPSTEYNVGMMKRLLPHLLSFIIAAVSLSAQDTESKAWTIPELVDIALQQNPETQVAWARAQRAAAALEIAKSSYYPSINWRSDAAHGYDYRFPNGREVSITTVGTDLALNYLLADGHERKANTNAARAALRAAGWQTNLTLQRVFFNVIQHAYLLLNAQALLKAHLDTLRDAQAILQSVDSLYQSGSKSIVDVEAQKSSAYEAQIAVIQQRAEVSIAMAQLATTLALPIGTPLRVVDLPDPIGRVGMHEELSTLLATAEKQRADLMAKRAELQQKASLVTKAKASFHPKIRLDAGSGFKHYMSDDNAKGFRYNVALSVDYPLFRGFEPTYSVVQAKREYEASSYELVELELEIAMEVLRQYSQFEAADEILSLARDNLSSVQKTFEGAQEKYRAGIVSIFDLTQVQRQLSQARVRQSEAKNRWYLSLANLAYATGTITNEDTCTAQ